MSIALIEARRWMEGRRMHKCDLCNNLSEHREPGFQTNKVCKAAGNDLAGALRACSAKECPYGGPFYGVRNNNDRWISVKDRLPENEETVLISAVRKCANGKHWNVVMTAFYTDGKLHTEDSSFAWDSDCVEMEYCEETDDYIIPEGWWEAVECGDEFSAVDLFVTHWMLLPEPPRGDWYENDD